MGKIGNVSEHEGEVSFKWKIKDFSLLSYDINVHYESQEFCSFGTFWRIQIFPNGDTQSKSAGWVGIYLVRTSNGPPIKVDFSCGIRRIDWRIDPKETYTDIVFDKKCSAWGNPGFIPRSKLVKDKSSLTPSDIITIICTLKNVDPHYVTGCFANRMKSVSDNLAEILMKEKRTDIILKVEGKTIPAHRMIIETRCPALLINDTEENETGEILVDGMDFETMHALLQHLYSGDIDELTREKVLPLYIAAKKYDLEDLKEVCSDFIVQNLSLDWVSHVEKFAEMHQDQYIADCCKEFRENANKNKKPNECKKSATNAGLKIINIITAPFT